MDSKQGSPFSEGRGRGFDIPERKELPATNAERTKAIGISLEDLNHPGKGPMNYQPQKGMDCVREDVSSETGGDGDMD